MKEMFSKHGVPQPQVFLATRPPWSPVQLEAGIRAGILAAGRVVVKPSHLTTGKAVFLVDKHLTGRSILPVGPGRKVMEEAAGKGGMRKFSLSDMERQLEEAMRENAGAREVKPLRECSRGVLVEEMVDHDGELRVLVLQGRVEVAATDSGVEAWRGENGEWEFSEEGERQGLPDRWTEVVACAPLSERASSCCGSISSSDERASDWRCWPTRCA